MTWHASIRTVIYSSLFQIEACHGFRFLYFFFYTRYAVLFHGNKLHVKSLGIYSPLKIKHTNKYFEMKQGQY